MTGRGSMGPGELQGHLLDRAERLRGYVATKIPATLARTISADDVLQETFVAAFRNVGTFVPNGPEALDRWLTIIANRKLLDALKAAHRLRRRGPVIEEHVKAPGSSSVGEVLAQLVRSSRTPSREFSLREATDAVQHALSGLGGERRRAIRLRFVEGLSTKRIAEKMGKSSAAVNSLLFHGLRELRRHLGHAARFFSDVRSGDSQTVEKSNPDQR